MAKIKKRRFIILKVVVALLVIVLLLISPIVKYLVEKYDVKYIGREITLSAAYVNPFNGYIHFSNFKMYELDSDSIFFSAEGLSGNLALRKIFSETYEIHDLTLDRPRGVIIQNKGDLNFNDIIELFAAKEDIDSTKVPIHFSILNIKVNDGEFHYHEELIPISYFIKQVNMESTGLLWNADTITVKYSFASGIGSGDMNGDFTINKETLDYRYAAVANKFDLQIIEQYLKDLTNYGNFSASIDADIKSTGNFNDSENISATGMLAINDFHFGKNPEEDYASFDKFRVLITQLSPNNHKYLFDTISLTQPYFNYERYDYLDNMQTIFGEGGSNVTAAASGTAKFNLILEIADYVKLLARNFFESDYKINRLAITDGDLRFNDYSISEKFTIGLNPLSVVADSIDKNHKRVRLSFKSGIKPYGSASIALSINPKDSGDFDMQYAFKELPATMFNPYIVSQTSYPLDRGTIELHGTWNVRNSRIKSDNHLVIIDPRVTKKVRNKDTGWIPVPLIMTFVRERGNVIDYEIPITGNLSDPKFHLRDVVFDLLENIFVKPATTPYRLQVNTIERDIEKSLTLSWPLRSSTILPAQEKFIKRMADFLRKNPEASITVSPQQYALKEKEYLLLFEAKKKYYLESHKQTTKSLSEDDSLKISKMSAKDSSFVQYLNKHVKDSMLFTIQGKCTALLKSGLVDTKFKQLNEEREDLFLSYFLTEEVEKQVKISKAENVIPYNGYSFYKIKYEGDLPEALIKAYQELNELNEEKPRDKFKEDRKEQRKNSKKGI
ncbi:MAG: DUF748 domain-containing protein [Flavobacteriales bacterium]|nr:DUF748 domain-containing protein [Flavobacteriales bacterium]